MGKASKSYREKKEKVKEWSHDSKNHGLLYNLISCSEAILLFYKKIYSFRVLVRGRYSLDFEKALLEMFVTDIQY